MPSVKIKVSVRNHRIADELPSEVPDGEAEVEIRFQGALDPGLERARRRHLESLFASIDQRSPNRTRGDIDRQIAEERASWGE